MSPKPTAGAACLLLLLPSLTGCAGACEGPASSRGFFCGIAAMATGADERGAARLENTAAAEEGAARAAGQRAERAQAEASRTGAEVRAAQRRLDALQQKLRDQRATLERLRAERGQSGAAEASRLQSELDALERDQRAAAQRAGGPSPETVRQIERRASDLDAALRRFGAI